MEPTEFFLLYLPDKRCYSFLILEYTLIGFPHTTSEKCKHLLDFDGSLLNYSANAKHNNTKCHGRHSNAPHTEQTIGLIWPKTGIATLKVIVGYPYIDW